MIVIYEQVEAIAQCPGLHACALVEVESGMVWHSAGTFPGFEAIGEAASDFWRLHGRIEHTLKQLGNLHAAMLSYGEKSLALVPCCNQPHLILVAVLTQSDVTWPQWTEQVNQLQQMLLKKFGAN